MNIILYHIYFLYILIYRLWYIIYIYYFIFCVIKESIFTTFMTFDKNKIILFSQISCISFRREWVIMIEWMNCIMKRVNWNKIWTECTYLAVIVRSRCISRRETHEEDFDSGQDWCRKHGVIYGVFGWVLGT